MSFARAFAIGTGMAVLLLVATVVGHAFGGMIGAMLAGSLWWLLMYITVLRVI